MKAPNITKTFFMTSVMIIKAMKVGPKSGRINEVSLYYLAENLLPALTVLLVKIGIHIQSLEFLCRHMYTCNDRCYDYKNGHNMQTYLQYHIHSLHTFINKDLMKPRIRIMNFIYIVLVQGRRRRCDK